MKLCKVIVVAYHLERIFRPQNQVRYPHHPQRGLSHDEQILMWNVIEYLSTTIDGGEPHDTIVVCNGEKAFAWWKDKHGKRTQNGSLIVLGRENNGGSFGGYNHAYRNTNYDGYIFTEDDMLIVGDNFYTHILEEWNKSSNPGFVGLVGISKRESTRHCHGGVGFTTREVLKSIEDAGGNLPHPQRRGWKQEVAIKYGEFPFTNKILQSGKDLLSLSFQKPEWCIENHIYPFYIIEQNSWFRGILNKEVPYAKKAF